jgi:signal transduction histidine kinase/DNA-binding response OmpR family regulator/ligand-binding sensor domain-containing protein
MLVLLTVQLTHCFNWTSAHAQQPETRQFHREWTFEQLSIRDGFPTNFIKDIHIEPDGKVWVATDFGLVQMEGGSRSIFRENLRSPSVKQVLKLPDGRLMMVTPRDVKVWTTDFESAVTFIEADGVVTDTTLFSPGWAGVDSSGGIWFSESRGIVLLKKNQLLRYILPPESHSKSVYRGYRIFPISLSKTLITSQTGMVWIFDNASGLLSSIALQGVPSGFTIDAGHLFSDGTLFLGGDAGVFELKWSYAGRSAFLEPVFGLRQTVTITEDRDGSIWLGTKAQGARKIRRNKSAFAVVDSLPRINRIKDLELDGNGNVWVASDDGLLIFYRQLFLDIPFPGDDTHVNELAVISPSRFAAVTRNHLYEVTLSSSGTASLERRYVSGDRTMSSVYARNGMVYVAFLDGGYLTFKDRATTPEPGAFTIAQPIKSIKAGKNSLWLIPETGISILRAGPDGIPDTLAVSNDRNTQLLKVKYEASSDHLYLLSQNNGFQLTCFSGSGNRSLWSYQIQPRNTATYFGIADIEVGENGSIWLATTQGVMQIEASLQGPAKERWVEIEAQFPYQLIRDLTIDLEGKLWIAAEHGLFVYYDGAITRFDSSHGLLSDLALSVRVSDKSLVTAHSQGISVLPGRLSFERTRAVPYIASAQRQAVAYRNRAIQVEAAEVIDFQAVALAQPVRMYTVQYRLNEAHWNDIPRQGQFTLPGLASGNHVLELRAIRTGMEAGPVRRYDLTVKPYWYNTWPAWLAELMMALLLGAVFWQYRQAVNERRRALGRLQETREQIQSVVSNAPVFLFATQHDGKLQLLEGQALRNMRLLPKEWIGKQAAQLFTDDAFQKSLVAALQGTEQNIVVERNSRAYDLHLVPVSSEQHRFEVHGIGVDITDQVMSERQLRLARDEAERAKEAAEQANRAKSQFLANMSHELRTPLNAIIGYAQVLHKDPDLGSRQQKFIRTMQESGYHLLSMINDILDLSKIESGQMDVAEQHLSIRKLAQDIEDMFKLQAEAQGLDFKMIVSTDAPDFILADANKLRQVIINLISNAIKYTERGAVRILVRPAETEKSVLHICVEDTGRGIPADQLEDIFKPFRQVQGQFNKGTGLGLTIVKNLAELMNGRIEVRSQPGIGSKFCLFVPYKSVNTPEPREQSLRFVLKRGESPVILVVDDVESNRTLLQEMLVPAGFTVVTAEDGAAGLERVRNSQPDIVLLDLNMPRLNGEEMLCIMRKEYPNQIPVIAVTAQGLQEHRDRAMQLGFSAFLTKPFLLQELLHLIHTTTGGRFTVMEGEESPESEGEDTAEVASWCAALTPEQRKVWLEALELTDLELLSGLAASADTPAEVRSAISGKDYRFLFGLDEMMQRYVRS